MSEFPRLTYRTTKPIGEVRTRIEGAAKERGFGVLAVHDLGAILASKGMPISYSAMVVEVCSPLHAKAVLEAEPAIANALPCRIAIYAQNGKTTIETLPPTLLLGGFGAAHLRPVAEEVEKLLKEIIESAL